MESKNKIFEKLHELENIIVSEACNLTKYSTMKATSHGTIVHVKTQEALVLTVNVLTEHKFTFRVIGWGANFVLPMSPDFILIKLSFEFNKKDYDFSEELDSWVFPASVGLNQLTSLAMKYGLMGWESFTGVPASLGGAICMNAGTSLGEIGDLIRKVVLMNSKGEIREHIINDDSFGYRENHFVKNDEIIIQAEMTCQGRDSNIHEKIKTYMAMRQETQPLKEKTCGCMFKNYKVESYICPAGQFIDIMGLKGFGMDGYRISPKHANFLENSGHGSQDGVVSSLDFIKSELFSQYGINFEQEIKF